jgi:hypothetical protein
MIIITSYDKETKNDWQKRINWLGKQLSKYEANDISLIDIDTNNDVIIITFKDQRTLSFSATEHILYEYNGQIT